MEKDLGSEVSPPASQSGVSETPVPAVSEVPAQVSTSTHQYDNELSVWSLQGRITRGEFWVRLTVLFGILVVPTMLLALIPNSRVSTGIADRIGPILLVPLLIGLFFACWFSLATQVKRWHDVNYSGWMVLFNLVPFAGIALVIILGCMPGTKGNNDYGIDPLSSGKA
jgi:uncharacterized membrane protein YhaH (DUF805 family)